MTRSMAIFLLVILTFGGAARAEPTEAERMARWSDLRHAIFGDRVVEDAGDLVAVDAPARAEDAAIVPVAIRVAGTLAPEIRGFYLIIDDNPSPLAAHFLLGPIAHAREIATRVRIDDYTYLHAVARNGGRPTLHGRTVHQGGRRLFSASEQGPGARPRTSRKNEIEPRRSIEA